MNRIEGIAKQVLKITTDDTKEIELIIQQQREYNNPLKMATTSWQHELAEHNQEILDAVLNLKTIIEKGKNIKKSNEEDLREVTKCEK